MFYFEVWDEHHLGADFFASRTFKINNGTAKSDSTSQTTAAARPSSTLDSSSLPQVTQYQSSEPGLSANTKIGLGLGVGVVVGVLIGIWWYIVYFRWRKELGLQRRSTQPDVDEGDWSAQSQ